MKIFKLNLFAKIIYRYAHIPISILLLFYITVSALGVRESTTNIFPLLINLILFYLVNRFYMRIYREVPFKIETNNEKIIFSDFGKKKEVVFEIDKIEKISGGIFDKKSSGNIFVEAGGEKVLIPPHFKDYNKLLTHLLSNVNKELYEELLKKVKDNTGMEIKLKKKK